MTQIYLWVNVIGVGLGFLGWLLWIFLTLGGAAAAGRHEGPGAAIFGAGLGVFLSLPWLVTLVLWLLVALMSAGWSLLALDAARNLRVMRYTKGT
jgi:hypothetical protein